MNKISFGTNSNSKENNIVKFFENRGMIFKKNEELTKIKENFFYILDINIKKNLTTNILDTIKQFKNMQCILLNNQLKDNKELNLYKKIYYPIEIFNFEKKIYNFLNINFYFNDLAIQESNFLINTNNNKKTYLTEVESNILKFLFKEKKTLKENLLKDILKLSPDVETKSLESHLSRIRKKINSIDSKVNISSIDSLNIKLS